MRIATMCLACGALARPRTVSAQECAPPNRVASRRPEDRSRPGDAWTEWRYDAANAGVLDRTIPGFVPWRMVPTERVQATPTVIGDAVFVGTHGTGDVYALDLATGRCRWRTRLPNWVHSDAVGDAGAIYVGYGNRSNIRLSDGRLVVGQGVSGVARIEAATGTIQWSLRTVGAHMSSPVLSGGRLLVSPSEGAIMSIDTASGGVVWKRDEHIHVSMASGKVDGGVLFLGGDPSTVVAVRVQDGTRLWRTELPGYSLATGTVTVAVDDSTVYTSAMRGLRTRELLRRGEVRMLVDRVFAFLHLTSWKYHLFQHEAFALDRQTGRVRWRTSLGIGPPVDDNTSGTPLLFGDAVIFTSPASRSVRSLDRRDGRERWHYNVGAMLKGVVSERAGHVYFGDFLGFVHELDARDGRPLRRTCFGGGFGPGGFTRVGDVLLFGTRDGRFFALPYDALFAPDTSLRPLPERRCDRVVR